MRVEFFSLEQASLSAGRQSWAEIDGLWLSISPVRGRLVLRQGAHSQIVSHKVRLRYHPQVAPGLRFRKGSRVLVIHHVETLDSRQRWQSCLCEEISNITPQPAKETP